MTEPPDARTRRVAAAAKRWRSELINISGSNRALFFRDLKVGTLSLDPVAPAALEELLDGKPVRTSRLFPDAAAAADATKSLKTINRQSREFAEEYGLRVTYVIAGFATWTPGADARPYSAPVLLRPAEVRPRPGTVDGFEVEVTGEPQLNPVLLHLLEAQHGIPVEDLETESDGEAFGLLHQLCAQALPGFSIAPRHVLANLFYADQTLVEDLDEDHAGFLAQHDLIAALAGDETATDAVRNAGRPVDPAAPDRVPPSDEHLVLDADGSQSYVINAVAGGQNLVVQGPPGTGKSQTIANVIAQLVAQDKRVLFVAQKRAAITAVLGRLEQVELGHLTLDLFATSGSRQAVVRAIGHAVEERRAATRPNVEGLHRRLEDSRALLVQSEAAMHELREPWGLALLGSYADGAPTAQGLYDLALDAGPLRFDVQQLLRWDRGSLERLAQVVEDFVAEGGTDPALGGPGWSVQQLTTAEAVNAAEQHLADLQRAVPAHDSALRALAAEVQASPDTDPALLIGLLTTHARVVRDGGAWLLDPALAPAELDQRARASGIRTDVSLGFFARRKLAKDTRARLSPGADTQAVLLAVLDLRRQWGAVSHAPLPPTSPPSLTAAVDARRAYGSAVVALQPDLQLIDLRQATQAVLDELARDRRRRSLPRLHQLRTELLQHGLEPLLRDPHPSAGLLTAAFARTVIEHLERTDPRLFGLDAQRLDRAVTTYVEADVTTREANAHRVRRAAAELLAQALDDHPQQAEVLRDQTRRKRGFKPVRQLLEEAPDVILAAKPVWAASPQLVSSLMPLRELFDVVLFDEASQVLPSAALPAIARGAQTVVAGDSLQLPPTTLFTRTIENVDDGEPAEDDLDDRTGIVVQDMESILDAVEIKLGPQRSRHLAWHYRSRDERLIDTSNTWVYRPVGRQMTTFPAADGLRSLSHIEVAPSTGLGPNNKSPADEVTEVIDLVFAHAHEQPHKSLGVIAFGSEHATRMTAELERRLALTSAELRSWFATAGAEPFFIKNIERVQGDERDKVILAVGYSHKRSGGLSYQWGPVMTAGGHRRVNVAISRAKEELVLVTSFRAEEVDERASASEGFALLRRFIHFASTHGESFGDAGPQEVALNPFEHDILRRLQGAGLDVCPQYGVGSYRLDFAVRHPADKGRFVLAVEADGASYHSGIVTRERDRLRQQALEKRGWAFVRLWSTDWFRDPESQVERVLAAYADALAAPDARPVAVEEPDWEPQVATRNPRPDFEEGLPIGKYTDADLDAVVRWVASDDLPHTRQEVFEMTKAELGFRRTGRIIEERLTAAVERAL